MTKVHFNAAEVIMIALGVYAELLGHQDIIAELEKRGKGNDGGYLCISDLKANVLLKVLLWPCDSEKLSGPCAASEEKVVRLSQHPQHTLSRQSENAAAGQYRGAVRAFCYLLGFSGLPGDLDELFVMALAIRLGWMKAHDVRRLLLQHSNDFATRGVLDTFF